MMNLFSRFNERGPGAPGQCLSPSLFLITNSISIHYRHAHPRSTPARRDRYPCRYRTQ
jgi:hypothetical protein